MEIEIEISVFNIKDGKLSDTFFDKLPWHVLSNHFKAKGGANSGSLFSSPDTFVVWETEGNMMKIDPQEWLKDNLFSKETIALLIDKKNWKKTKLSFNYDLKLETTPIWE